MNNYNERLQQLTKQVDQITDTDGGGLKSILPKNINYKLIGAISIPVIIILLLIFYKSPLVMSKTKDENKKKINSVKVFSILAVIAVGEFAFYFFYWRKRNQPQIMP